MLPIFCVSVLNECVSVCRTPSKLKRVMEKRERQVIFSGLISVSLWAFYLNKWIGSIWCDWKELSIQIGGLRPWCAPLTPNLFNASEPGSAICRALFGLERETEGGCYSRSMHNLLRDINYFSSVIKTRGFGLEKRRRMLTIHAIEFNILPWSAL